MQQGNRPNGELQQFEPALWHTCAFIQGGLLGITGVLAIFWPFSGFVAIAVLVSFAVKKYRFDKRLSQITGTHFLQMVGLFLAAVAGGASDRLLLIPLFRSVSWA